MCREASRENQEWGVQQPRAMTDCPELHFCQGEPKKKDRAKVAELQSCQPNWIFLRSRGTCCLVKISVSVVTC